MRRPTISQLPLINELFSAPGLQVKTGQAIWTRGTASIGLAKPVLFPDRVLYWPRGIPRGRSIAFLSSRLGLAKDRHPAWFRALRERCADIDNDSELIVTVETTTANEFVVRCAEMYDARLLVIRLAKPTESFGRWLRRVVDLAQRAERYAVAYLSPRICSDQQLHGGSSHAADSHVATPLADRFLIACADELRLLRLRERGKLAHILFDPCSPVHVAEKTACVLNERSEIHQRMLDQLVTCGWSTWNVPTSVSTVCNTSLNPPVVSADLQVGSVIRVDGDSWSAQSQVADTDPLLQQVSTWDYLTHCTRRCHGAWPSQSREEYLDELILGLPAAERSPLASLCRILKTRTIFASHRLIRGRFDVVCFTESDWQTLRQSRVYRSHLSRWDFQPYGIAIKKETLQRLGARPVIYGDTETWDSLQAEHRPFFQRARSTGKRSDREIDWTTEREWRLLGDCPLDRITLEEAMVFVSSPDEIPMVAQISRWPVVVLPTI